MYVPRHFRHDKLADLHALIEGHRLGVLITELDGRLEATHVPCLLDRGEGANGVLRFHLARANPSAGALQAREALVVFCGPAAYISPDWYQSKHQVPTWNYLAVHAYGRPAPLGDDGLRTLLEDLSAAAEADLPKAPWTTDKLPPDLYAKMRNAIVGFRMPIDELQGKWKLGQNRSAGDRAGAAGSLRALDRPGASAIADLMAELD